MAHVKDDRLLVYLQDTDLTRLCRDGREVGLVSQTVKENFDSLDDNVSHSTKVRYLWLHVCQQVRENSRLWERLLTVLSQCGVSRDVLEQLRLSQDSYCPVESCSHVSSETGRLAEGISEVLCDYGGGDVAVGEKRPHGGPYCFTEEHIAPLTEILTNCSSKYQEIGFCLRLPEHVREESRLIAEKYHKVIFGLERVLKEWIVGQHKRAKSPTVESLEGVLSSGIVRETCEAEKLKENLLKHGIYLEHDEPSTSSKRPRLDTVPFEVVSQTRDCVVREKSTLLEVQVCSTSSLSYQWIKDGSPLTDSTSDGYSGTETEILCINNASLSSEGTYSCEIKCQDLVTHSEPVVVTVKMSPLKRVLVDIYDAKSEVPKDSWPPVTNNTYINLALIKSGNIDNANEYTRYTFQDDMDDIYNNKDHAEYEEVFSYLPSGSRLLIEGRPGSGKTTLVHKFSQDWARNKLKLNSINFLFLVHLRGFFSSPDIQLSDIIKQFYSDQSDTEEILSFAKQNSGEGLCFVLDGLDEYSPKNKKNTPIFKLINKEIYPKAVVVVASRPAATAPIRQVASKRVEVLGFLKEQISQYIDSYKFKSPGTNVELRASLDQRQNVERMCYLPIHAVMVCYLFDVDGFLPRTETEMYTQFTIQTLLRTLNRSGGRKYLAQVEDLPNGEKEVYLEICKLSYEKTVSSKQVMKRNEVEHFFREIDSGNESLGLITVDHMAEKCGFQDLYTFLHLTHQEYLAAYHISKLEEKEQAKVVEKYGKKKQMLVVWKFYCGLVDFTDQVCRFEKIVQSNNSKDDLFPVQCAFESQQTITCDYLATLRKENSLIFRNQFLTPSDFTAIGYVISKATHPVNKLVLDRCNFRDEGVSAFLDEVGNKVFLLKKLCFHKRECVREQFKSLNSLLKVVTSLEELDLTETTLGPKKNNDLTPGVSLPSLQLIKISSKMENFNISCPALKRVIVPLRHFDFNRIKITFGVSVAWNSLASLDNVVNVTEMAKTALSHNDVEMLSAGLRENSCCTSLILTNCNIDDGGAKTLADSFSCITGLKVLKLNINEIGDEGATGLVQSFRICTQICSVDFSFNNITNTGALAIAKSLSDFSSLEELDMRCNEIDGAGATAITKAMKDTGNIADIGIVNSLYFKKGLGINSGSSLELVNSKLNDEIIPRIVCSIRKSHTILQILNFKRNSIGCDGAKALADDIKHCNNLQTLNLDRNRIGSAGAKALADGLRHCYNLQTLNLNSNSIGSAGAKALADGLKHCNNLQTLNLKSNSIGSEGANALADSLQYCNNLQTLNLDFNSIGFDGAKALADGLKHCNNLQILNLGYNSIGCDGAKALADGLKHCNNLQTLNFFYNSIGSDGAKALADGLKQCNNLKTLDLHDNNIGSDGAKALADGIKHCNSLQTLDLSLNSIGSDGAEALANGLKHCNNLQILYLCRSSIGSDGAKALADGIKHCNNLQTLNLGSNNIGSDGAKVLADGLKHCNYLQTLHFHFNSIGSDGAKALADGLKHCNNLQTLTLRYNSIGSCGAKALADCLKHCNLILR